MRRLLGFLLLGACAGGDDDSGVTQPGTTAAPCTYPEAVSPMTLGEVMPAFSWNGAKSLVDGAKLPLDLTNVHCDTDPDIDWSPFDVLVFVSVPAW